MCVRVCVINFLPSNISVFSALKIVAIHPAFEALCPTTPKITFIIAEPSDVKGPLPNASRTSHFATCNWKREAGKIQKITFLCWISASRSQNSSKVQARVKAAQHLTLNLTSLHLRIDI